MIETRWSTSDDANALAELHRDAWRYAYAGIIPGLALEQMIAARGPRWWRRMHGAGMRALVVEIDGRVSGYATLGRGRFAGRAVMGEIYELYIRPEAQGTGLGRRLFADARGELARHGLSRLHVWSLAENQVGCRFYLALGGQEWIRGHHPIGAVDLEKIGFRWT